MIGYVVGYSTVTVTVYAAVAVIIMTITKAVITSVVCLLLVRGANGGRDGDRWWWTVVGWRSHGMGRGP